MKHEWFHRLFRTQAYQQHMMALRAAQQPLEDRIRQQLARLSQYPDWEYEESMKASRPYPWEVRNQWAGKD